MSTLTHSLTQDFKRVWQFDMYILQYILLWLPLIYMLSYMGYKILDKLGITQRFCRKRQHPIYFDASAGQGDQSESEIENDEDHQDE